MGTFKQFLEDIDECIRHLIRAKTSILCKIAEIINKSIVPVVQEKLGYKVVAVVYTDYEDPTWIEVKIIVEHPRIDEEVNIQVNTQNVDKVIEKIVETEEKIKKQVVDLIEDDSIIELIDKYIKVVVL